MQNMIKEIAQELEVAMAEERDLEIAELRLIEQRTLADLLVPPGWEPCGAGLRRHEYA
jgi:hypothetical protein